MPTPSALYDEFLHPGAEWRGKPFWSWNGELDEAELLRQLDVLAAMGMGGFFMHSRTGLATEYLGDEWFRLTNVCADEAARQGLEAWLYDEDRWPSGTAGGLVTADERFRAKFLSMRRGSGDEFEWDDAFVAAFAVDLDGLAVSNAVRITAETPRESFAGREVIGFSIEEQEPSSFYNGQTYVDTLNPEATTRYLELTHEQYLSRCGDRLGSSIQGIFTDEPHRGPLMCGFSLANHNRAAMAPWTPALFDEFERRFGYDLRDKLLDLFLQPDGRAVSPVKWHYCELLQSLFLESFAQPLYDWCEQHGMRLTGHALHEDNLTSQTAMQGSLMRFYAWQHDPGIDLLTEGNRGYWIAKQLQSAARQLGRKWLLSELYGCSGWQMSFESHKAVGDWQALFGINVRCHHLSWYTMEGEAKRDYPASILHQSAWWRDYGTVEDYFARLGLLLSQGEPACDVLVLNPVESVWAQVHIGWADSLSPTTKPVQALERAYAELFFMLAGAQIDFDYGDEAMLAELGAVESDVLRLGQARYRVAVVPTMTTIRATTLTLLEQFVASGGQVVFAGDPPVFVDAVPSIRPRLLAAKAVRLLWDTVALREALQPLLTLPIEVVDADGHPIEQVFCQVRRDGERLIVVALNTDPGHGCAGMLRMKATGTVTEWVCASGARFGQPATLVGECLEWPVSFPSSGGRVYVINDGLDPAPPRPAAIVGETVELAGPFEYELDEPNVLVLDRARWRVDGGEWQPAAEILKVDQRVRDHFGLPHRGGEMVQPWFRAKFGTPAEVLGRVELGFTFGVEAIPEEPVELALERPEAFEAQLNGVRIPNSVHGWWVDRAFQRLGLPPGALRLGHNELVLAVDFRDTTNLEAVYLLGGFGVRLDDAAATITPLPDRLSPSDFASQGLPFYGAGVTLHLDLPEGARLLAVPEFEAACLRVRAGDWQQVIAWQPYQTELPNGVRNVDLDVVLTRRNTFGPLHLVPTKSAAYGPAHWVTEGAAWSDAYQLWPSGLLGPVEVRRQT